MLKLTKKNLKTLLYSRKNSFGIFSNIVTNYNFASEVNFLKSTLDTSSSTLSLSQAFSKTFDFSIFKTLKELNLESIAFMSEMFEFNLGSSIILITLFYRIILLVPNLLSLNNTLKMQMLQVEIKEMTDKAQSALKSQNMALYKQYQNAPQAFYKKYGIKLHRNFYNFLIIPAYISMFFFFKELTYNPSANLKNPDLSFLWIHDITQPDPYFILPVISAFFSYLLIKLNNNMMPVNSTLIKKFRAFFPFLPFLGILPLATFPAGLSLYWFTLSFLNYLMYITIQTKLYRRLMSIPDAFPGTILYDNIMRKNKVFQKASFVIEKERLTVSNKISPASSTKLANTNVIKNTNPNAVQNIKVFRHKPKSQYSKNK